MALSGGTSSAQFGDQPVWGLGATPPEGALPRGRAAMPLAMPIRWFFVHNTFTILCAACPSCGVPRSAWLQGARAGAARWVYRKRRGHGGATGGRPEEDESETPEEQTPVQ
jgi:hypothetical protein